MNAYQNGKKIDCHTHIYNEQIRAEYFSRTSGYAIVMQLQSASWPTQTAPKPS